jgi:hypothetical protein
MTVHKLPEKHLVANCGSKVIIISLPHVRMIAGGHVSIAEFEDPDAVAQAIAKALVEMIDEKIFS